MRRAVPIARRDFAAYFLSPGGYIVMALFLFSCAWLFSFAGFIEGAQANLRSVFAGGVWFFLVVGPAITMRLVSEEVRVGTAEMLLTSPATEVEIICGKFAASMGFLMFLLSPTLLFVVAIEWYGSPDYGELLCGYFGLLLAASAFVACGLFASTLTTSQPVAFLGSIFFWIVLFLGTKFLPNEVSKPLSNVFVALDPDLRLRDFVIGLLDTGNVAYFVAISAFFLTAAVKSLQSRRWR